MSIVIWRKCAKQATFNTFQTICYLCIALLVNYYVEINGSRASIVCANACGGNGLISERTFEKNKFLKKLILCYGHPITIPKRVQLNQLGCQEHAFMIHTCTRMKFVRFSVA